MSAPFLARPRPAFNLASRRGRTPPCPSRDVAPRARAPRRSIIASFGGLLMLLQGEQRHLVRIELDQKIYALIRKVGASSSAK